MAPPVVGPNPSPAPNGQTPTDPPTDSPPPTNNSSPPPANNSANSTPTPPPAIDILLPPLRAGGLRFGTDRTYTLTLDNPLTNPLVNSEIQSNLVSGYSSAWNRLVEARPQLNNWYIRLPEWVANY